MTPTAARLNQPVVWALPVPFLGLIATLVDLPLAARVALLVIMLALVGAAARAARGRVRAVGWRPSQTENQPTDRPNRRVEEPELRDDER